MRQDHLVICGLSNVAACAADLFCGRSGVPDQILVIDWNPAKVEAARKLGYSFILGDATSLSSLRIAQAAAAAAILVCVDDGAALTIIRQAHCAAPQTPIKVVLKDKANKEAAMQSGASEVLVLSQLAGNLLAESALKTRE